MKKFIAVLTTLLLVLTLTACGKKVDRSKYDEGEQMDADSSSQYAEENKGDPYAQSEIGHYRAHKNLIIAMGSYDSEKESYVTYEYVKDGYHEGKPCYFYSKRLSKTQFGEYKHDCYMAVYKDGSMVASDVDLT